MNAEFTRKQLYDLVWSQPMTTVAASVGISDVALAKHCKKANIPVPSRVLGAQEAGETDDPDCLATSLPRNCRPDWWFSRQEPLLGLELGGKVYGRAGSPRTCLRGRDVFCSRSAP